ncbi:MAG: methionine--tRNA ligase subunit beta, partial [Syntrophomonadaceae bacterium]|nr:methionine--tRNA ligase subunit beta [Syntrophomonadaceae bacterium]
DALDEELRQMALTAYKEATDKLDKLDFSAYLNAVSRLVSRANKYIDETEPWKLAKDEAGKKRLATVMYNLVEAIRIALILTAPAMPALIERANQQLNIFDLEKPLLWEDGGVWGITPVGARVSKGKALFPRIDIKTLEENEVEENKAPVEPIKEEKATPVAEVKEEKTYITIEEFAKMDLRVAEVIGCEKMEKADKLLILKLKVGEEERTVVSGIAQHYKPEDLIGKKVVLVANLKPSKLRGVMSEGMILAASDEGHQNLEVLTLQSELPSGNRVK